MENIKKSMIAGMLCTIDGDIFHLFGKKTWIRDLGASCHTANDDTDLNDVTNINTLVQGSSGHMSAMKKCKLSIKLHQVDGSERVSVI